MATLSQLVAETTDIKNELVTCHSNLKNNLIEKGVECSDMDKMSSLIDKVGNIKTEKHNLPDWYRTEDSWISASNLEVAHDKCVSTLVDDKMYIFGATSPYNTNECYDINTDKLIQKTSMPTSRSDSFVASVGTDIYVIDGYVSTLRSANECYDTLTDTWTTKASKTTTLQKGGCVAIGTDIYCIGGTTVNYSSATNINECYDTLTDTWTTKTKMSSKRYAFGAVSGGTDIYCLGGYTPSQTSLNSNDCYDTLTGTWTTKTSMPQKNYDFSATCDNYCIYCIGGNGAKDYNFVYDIQTDVWKTKASMLNGRTNLATEVIGDKIVAFGGKTSSSGFKNEIYLIK